MIIKLKSVNKKLVWGEEDWLISAHKNGISTVSCGKFAGMGLDELYEKHRELFNNVDPQEFPLLVKIIDAKDDLSVQVHPEDAYAKAYENSLGKTECWYVLDCSYDSDIIVGQKTRSKSELIDALLDKKMMNYLNVLDVNRGDFFYIESGTVHAIRSNTKILEIQQSSDITYRLYDYMRRDNNGKLRELHIEKGLDVIDYSKDYEPIKPTVLKKESCEITCFIKSEFFDVYKIDVTSKSIFENTFDYLIGVSLTESIINGEKIEPFEGFIIPHGYDVEVSSKSSIILSTVVTNR